MGRASLSPWLNENLDKGLRDCIGRMHAHQERSDAMVRKLLEREGRLRRAGRCRYTLHNLLGHPLMEAFHLVGLRRAAWWIHQATLPKEERDDEIAQAVRAGEYFQGPRP